MWVGCAQCQHIAFLLGINQRKVNDVDGLQAGFARIKAAFEDVQAGNVFSGAVAASSVSLAVGWPTGARSASVSVGASAARLWSTGTSSRPSLSSDKRIMMRFLYGLVVIKQREATGNGL
jgi:hypothetical protein